MRIGGLRTAQHKITVVFEPEPEDPEPEAEDPEPNTIFAGEMENGERNPAGWVIYRIYIPDDAEHPTGGVPLPRVSLVTGDGAIEVPLEACSNGWA